MPEVHRIWRIVTSAQSTFEVELLPNQSGQNLVKVSEADSSTGALSFLDVDTARTLSQAIFEACEVASALARQAAGRSPNPAASFS